MFTVVRISCGSAQSQLTVTILLIRLCFYGIVWGHLELSLRVHDTEIIWSNLLMSMSYYTYIQIYSNKLTEAKKYETHMNKVDAVLIDCQGRLLLRLAVWFLTAFTRWRYITVRHSCQPADWWIHSLLSTAGCKFTRPRWPTDRYILQRTDGGLTHWLIPLLFSCFPTDVQLSDS